MDVKLARVTARVCAARAGMTLPIRFHVIDLSRQSAAASIPVVPAVSSAVFPLLESRTDIRVPLEQGRTVFTFAGSSAYKPVIWTGGQLSSLRVPKIKVMPWDQP